MSSQGSDSGGKSAANNSTGSSSSENQQPGSTSGSRATPDSRTDDVFSSTSLKESKKPPHENLIPKVSVFKFGFLGKNEPKISPHVKRDLQGQSFVLSPSDQNEPNKPPPVNQDRKGQAFVFGLSSLNKPSTPPPANQDIKGQAFVFGLSSLNKPSTPPPTNQDPKGQAFVFGLSSMNKPSKPPPANQDFKEQAFVFGRAGLSEPSRPPPKNQDPQGQAFEFGLTGQKEFNKPTPVSQDPKGQTFVFGTENPNVPSKPPKANLHTRRLDFVGDTQANKSTEQPLCFQPLMTHPSVSNTAQEAECASSLFVLGENGVDRNVAPPKCRSLPRSSVQKKSGSERNMSTLDSVELRRSLYQSDTTVQDHDLTNSLAVSETSPVSIHTAESVSFGHPPSQSGEMHRLQELLLSFAARLTENEITGLSREQLERTLREKDDDLREKKRIIAELEGRHNDERARWEENLEEKNNALKEKEASLERIRNDLESCKEKLNRTKLTSRSLKESMKHAEAEKDKATSAKMEMEDKIKKLENERTLKKDSSDDMLKRNIFLQKKYLVWKALGVIGSKTLVKLRQSQEEAMKELEEKRTLNRMLQSVLKDALDEARSREEARLNDQALFNGHITELQQKLQLCAARCEELELERMSLITENEGLTNNMQDLNDTNQLLQEDNEDLKAKAHGAGQVAENDKHQLTSMQLKNQELEAKTRAATEQMKLTAQTVVTLQMRLTQADATADLLRREMDTKTQRLHELQDAVDKLNAQKLPQDLELQKAKFGISNLENKVKEAASEIQSLKTKVEAYKGEIERGAKALAERTREIERLHQELTRKEDEILRHMTEAERARKDLQKTKDNYRYLNNTFH